VTDPIRADFDAAATDPTAQQILTDAVARLKELVESTVADGKVSNELTRVALAMFAPTLKLLRYDLYMFENSTPEQWERVAKASEAAGDLAIARAVIGVEHASLSAIPKENQ
jgi:hypothetical protein